MQQKDATELGRCWLQVTNPKGGPNEAPKTYTFDQVRMEILFAPRVICLRQILLQRSCVDRDEQKEIHGEQMS